MGGSLEEARKRLPSLQNLEQAAELLNIPDLDEADRNMEAPMHLQQAALLARIADWTGLSTRAAKELGDLYPSTPAPYAYIIETLDEHSSTWWNANPANDSGGIEESLDSPATYAVTVMNRYLDHMKAHPDVYEDAICGELHVRVSVWPIHSVTAAHPCTAPNPDRCPPAHYGYALKASKISPYAVEIRTPLQVHNYVYNGGITV